MKLLIKIIIPIVLLFWSAFAAQWYLPWIDLIPREEWWASESRWWVESGRFDKVYERNAEYESRLKEWWENEEFEARKEKELRQAARSSLLANSYPEDIAIDQTIRKDWEKTLVWPQQIVHHKRKIIIHHTADSFTYETPWDVSKALEHFYKLHTLKNWWWDIGYNFLIDPFGKVYEWRNWWQGVVGAHADWNNSSTLWIAMMWNFEKNKPTPVMIRSLIKLCVSLWYYYDIRPSNKMPYFTAIEEEPYLEIGFHDAVVWHKDTKNTACPWVYLYEKIPAIKKEITTRMNWLAMNWVKKLTDSMFETIEKPFIASWNKSVVWINTLNNDKDISCTLLGTTSSKQECRLIGDKIILPIYYKWVGSSWVYTLWIKQWDDVSFVEYSILWEDELKQRLIKEKSDRVIEHDIEEPISKKKSSKVITISEAKQTFEKSLSVLLYELTTEYDRREFRCEWSCFAIVNDQKFSNPSIIDLVKQEDGSLIVYIDQQWYNVQSFWITSPWLITVKNYDRETSGHPLNTFKWSITITKSKRHHLELWEQEWRAVINTLSFKDYLRWIGEWSESQHPEKLKVLALLSKQYALWYAAWENIHPSIPEWVGYTAIDDPRSFQRYVWAWWEWYAQKRIQAVEAVNSKIIAYNNTLPILPYFHCSPWFTRSWFEKRWRTDTPWLKWVLDPKPCTSGEFKWHGVGLSWDGAEAMAKAWVKMEEILEWFYNGIEVIW